jgi:uncharacterized protein (TIGR03118 family)
MRSYGRDDNPKRATETVKRFRVEAIARKRNLSGGIREGRMRIAGLICVALMICLGASAQTNSYTVKPIIDHTQDRFLVNPWGLSREVSASFGENEWWASDNGTGVSTLYYADQTGARARAGLVVIVPPASGSGKGTPTGTAYNAAKGPGPGANNFAFVTLDGTLSNWNAGQTPKKAGSGCYQCHTNRATVMVNHSSTHASYTGMAEATNATTHARTYYAANHNGRVEAYDAATFRRVKLAGKFSDPTIPKGYKAYGIQAVGSRILVTFFNGTSGGYVDSFDTNGNRKLRLAQGGFDQPWGVALAPTKFGAFSNMLLVGNTSSGWISAYDPKTGAFKGFLNDSNGYPITIPGLWGIEFGNGNSESGPTNTLYYGGGGNDFKTGVFGAITAD